VGKVTDFTYGFSGNRDQTGGSAVLGGNTAAESFNADLSKWQTGSATSMAFMFNLAKEFNSYLGG